MRSRRRRRLLIQVEVDATLVDGAALAERLQQSAVDLLKVTEQHGDAAAGWKARVRLFEQKQQREHAMAGRFPAPEVDAIEVMVRAVQARVRKSLGEMGYDEKAIDQIVAPRVGQWRADAEAHAARRDEIVYGGSPYHLGPPSNAAELRDFLRRISEDDDRGVGCSE